MDTSTSITAPDSVFFRGQWHAATWLAEVVDESTGELIITATLAGAEREPVVAALRMTMELARKLRAAAGFEGARPGVEERLDELERKHDAFYATVQTAFALAQRADAEAEMREVAGEAARNAVGGCSYQLTEHWQRIEELTSGMIALEERLHTLSGVVRLTQGRLALVADDGTADALTGQYAGLSRRVDWLRSDVQDMRIRLDALWLALDGPEDRLKEVHDARG